MQKNAVFMHLLCTKTQSFKNSTFQLTSTTSCGLITYVHHMDVFSYINQDVAKWAEFKASGLDLWRVGWIYGEAERGSGVGKWPSGLDLWRVG